MNKKVLITISIIAISGLVYTTSTKALSISGIGPGSSFEVPPAGSINNRSFHTTDKTNSENNNNFTNGGPYCPLSATKDKGLEEALKSRSSIDYSKIITPDTEILMFGEQHQMGEVKQELAQNMELFKQLGFTHMGMEMFETSAQGMLDEFYKTGSNEKEILNYLNQRWGYSEMSEKYLQLLRASRKAGIKIVALDMSDIQQASYESISRLTAARNQHMSKKVKEILSKNPNNKIITLTGLGHIGGKKGLKTLMEEKGYNRKELTSVAFTGSKNNQISLLSTFDLSGNLNNIFDSLNKDLGLNKIKSFESIVRKKGLNGTKFMVKVDEYSSYYDWYIHLPD